MIKAPFRLAFLSLMNRKFTTGLTVVSIALSVGLLLGVEKIRVGARDSFNNTISQTDLIVGARTGPIQLLLYSVFHMGNATNNITYDSYLAFKNHKNTEWTIPYSLGDSHRGFRVVGTDENFYAHYHYRQDHSIRVIEGKPADDVFDVVLGADVAKSLNYKVGQHIVLSHGLSNATSDGNLGANHEDKPFNVVGILDKTTTPIDRSLYITLEGMEAIHMDWQNGAPPMDGSSTPVANIKKESIKIGQITAFLLRTKSRIHAIYLQRDVNNFKNEPLLAILPGVTLSELWQTIGYAEDGLRMVSILVVVSGFFGMLIALYTSLNERRREMAIFRALGAGPTKILGLLVFESTLLTFSGICLGVGFLYGTLFIASPIVEHEFGIFIGLTRLSQLEWIFIASIQFAGILVGLVPAIKAYQNALTDGLTIRV